MGRIDLRVVTVGCALGLVACSEPASIDLQAQAPGVDPEAVELLRSTTEWLGSLDRFAAQAQSTFEDELESGHRVDYELFGTSTVLRPNKLRSERHGHEIDQVFYYDGETLVLHNPSDGVYATEPAPGTIDEMFQFVYDHIGIGTPISDLVHEDAFPLLMQDVDFATVIGKEVIAGVRCDHVLFSRPGVDFQIWVADSGPPKPVKYVVTDTTTPAGLSVSAVFTNWDLDPDVSDSQFTFEPPPGVSLIPFIKFDASSGSDR